MAAVLACGAASSVAAQGLAPIGAPRDRPLFPTSADLLADAAFLDREAYLRAPLALFAGEDLGVARIRSWPRAINFTDGKLQLDVSPHAAFGVGARGGSAEAGATLTVGQKREQRAIAALKDMGVRDGLDYGDQGRWYLFAAASGRAVGLNILRTEGDWQRTGWSTDPSSALVGDAHVGVGYRKGDIQSSFGVIHREVKGAHRLFGVDTYDDTVAAFTFAIRPRH